MKSSLPLIERIAQPIQRSWKHLIGVAIVPPFMVLGDALGVPFVLLAVPMFIAFAIAMWPWLSGREPFSFWACAVVVWLASGALAAIAAKVLNAIAV